jgi:hypothetical protein
VERDAGNGRQGWWVRVNSLVSAAAEAARWCANNPWSTLALAWAARGAVDTLPAIWRLLAATARLVFVVIATKLRALRQRREERRREGQREDRRIVVRVPW